jgi:hypothetical protein
MNWALKNRQPRINYMADLFYNRSIRELDQKAARAEATAEQAQIGFAGTESDVRLLRLDVERLMMITEALWTLLKEQHGYTDDELVKRVNEIDMRDGALNGQVAAELSPVCPQCHRQQPIKHRPLCLYCGSPVGTDDPFHR